jgi:3-oxoacyl-(acyl-carrier-protein) synthase
MSAVKPVVVEMDMVSAYGRGIQTCWQGLLAGETAIRVHDRFNTSAMASNKAATLADITPEIHDNIGGRSLVLQMLLPLLEKKSFPAEVALFLATTLGEIEYLERAVLTKDTDAAQSNPAVLLEKIQTHCGIDHPGLVISSACTSSATAIARAADMICRDRCNCALILACDCVSEFISAGFSSLMAMSPDEAHPFDADRQGLSIGDAAGYILLMSDNRAQRENREIMGTIAGWGLSGDAYHMTGPAPDGNGLARAIDAGLQKAGIKPEDVGSIAAHGTGTIHNDAMEIQAFKRAFAEPVPIYSIKGGTGHTMGAAGLIETIIGLQTLHDQQIPPTVNLNTPDPEGTNWINTKTRSISSKYSVTTNSGFGGTNCALILDGDA